MTEIRTTITTKTRRTVTLTEEQVADALRKCVGAPDDAVVTFDGSYYFGEAAIEWTREETVENPFEGKDGEHDAGAGKTDP